MGFCANLCETTSKVLVGTSGAITAIVGIFVVVIGVKTRQSYDFQEMNTMENTADGDAFDPDSAVFGFIILGAVIALAGFCGCCGAARENRCMLCLFSGFSLIQGVGLLIVVLMMKVAIEASGHELKKEINRICGPQAEELLMTGLNCTAPPDVADRRLGGEATTGQWKSEYSFAFAFSLEAAFGSRRGVASVAPHRELLAGTTEESLIVRTCSRMGDELCPNPCALIRDWCKPPEGFNPETACVCDRQGPRARGSEGVFVPATCDRAINGDMCAQDYMGRKLGVFCQRSNQTWADAEDEYCFVLPSAKCGEKGGTVPAQCSIAGESTCKSNGPCVDPDSRSKMYNNWEEIAVRILGFTFILAVLGILTGFFTCCLCCELHTGKDIGEHTRSLIQNEPLEEYSEHDEQDFLYQ